MMPANQGLEARDALRFRIDQRLIIEIELTTVERVPQLELERQSFAHPKRHVVIEHRKRVAPSFFRLIQCNVGVFQQDLVIPTIIRIDTDTDAGSHLEVLLIDFNRNRDVLVESVPQCSMHWRGHANPQRRLRIRRLPYGR